MSTQLNIKQLLERSKVLISNEQYEGAIACINIAIDTLYPPVKGHCPETCQDPGGYCECKSELNNGE